MSGNGATSPGEDPSDQFIGGDNDEVLGSSSTAAAG